MTSTKQDRRIAKERAGAAKAETIIAEAVARAQANPTPPKAKRGAPVDTAHAPAIKAAREQNVAWWRIAFDLGLPGSADTVAKGKAGAGLARRIYAAAYGALPQRPVSERTLKRKSEKDEGVKAIKATPKAQRVEAARQGEHVIPLDMSDDEVIAMLRGRVIVWSRNMNDLDGKGDSWSDDTACIHSRWCRIMINSDGERCVSFKEMDLTARSVDARSNPGATRIVRLSRIHTVGAKHS